MTEIHQLKIATFNSPLETGIRALTFLTSAFPDSFDLNQLLQFDYLMVHSGDVGGPDSLHPPLPLRSGELLVRRGLIEKGLLLMMSRELVQRVPGPSGIEYRANDIAGPFTDALSTSYLKKLKECAVWVYKKYGDTSAEELRGFMNHFFDEWTSEFQPYETSHGVDT